MTSPVCEEFPALIGRQEPHHLSVFEGSHELAEKALTLAQRVRAIPLPWQRDSLRAIMSTRPDGKWTHATCCILCPRQNGKSEIILWRCLYGLFVLKETIVFTAQRWRTAEKLCLRMIEMIKQRPSLRNRLTKKPTMSQGRGRITIEGAEIEFCTRSTDAGRGLDRVDLIVLDEAYNIIEAELAAIKFVQMASPNPQTIYMSTAVNEKQHANGAVLSGIRTNGLAHKPRLYLAEFMAPKEMPYDDPATWHYANPSYGIIQDDEKIADAMTNFATAEGRESFGVEVLGRGLWPVPKEDIPPLIAPELWEAMRNPSPQLVGPVALAMDMTPDRQWLTIAAALWTTAGRVHVEIGYHGPNTRGMVGRIVNLVTRMDPCALVIDKVSPAFSLKSDLLTAGLEPTITDTSEIAAATGDFYDKVQQQLLDHTGDPVLVDAVAGAVKRDMSGGGWAWDRKGTTNVISPLVAATLATWGLLRFGASTAPVQKLVHRPAAAPASGAMTSAFGERGLDLAVAGF